MLAYRRGDVPGYPQINLNDPKCPPNQCGGVGGCFGEQYYSTGKASLTSARGFRHVADTTEGHSGSPVWRYVDGEHLIVGVHVAGFGGLKRNYACKITATRFNLINQLRDDFPSEY